MHENLSIFSIRASRSVICVTHDLSTPTISATRACRSSIVTSLSPPLWIGIDRLFLVLVFFISDTNKGLGDLFLSPPRTLRVTFFEATSRCSGRRYFIPRKANIESSSGNTSGIFSVSRSSPFSFLYSPCSLSEYPFRRARMRIWVLRSLLPVKYRVAKGYSSAGLYKKSTRRALRSGASLAMTRLFVGPRDSTSVTIPSFTSFEMKSWNVACVSVVTITSISPESSLPRR